MIRWLPALALLAVGVAVAGTDPYLSGTFDEIMAEEGLVILELTTEGRCEEEEQGITARRTRAYMSKFDVKAAVWPRKLHLRDLDKIVKGGKEVAPMRFAYKDGVEIDRTCGCATSEELTRWMGGLFRGMNSAERALADLPDPMEDLKVSERLGAVYLHKCAGRHLDAFRVLETLWTLIPEKAPEYRQIRLTTIATEMGALARMSPEVNDALTQLRDSLTYAKDDDFASLDDWIALNRILLDDEATLRWHAEAAGDPETAKYAAHAGLTVWLVYTERKEFDKAGAVIGDPDAWFKTWSSLPGGIDQATVGYASLIAAGRTKDATKLAKAVQGVDKDTGACRLVQASVDAGTVDKGQKGLVKACKDPALESAWSGLL